jgi:ATP-dependent Clp protease adapter protein ClpS
MATDAQTISPTTAGDLEAMDLFDHEGLWLIIVWDDPVTTFAQVIIACVVLLGHSKKRASALADEVDSRGWAVVGCRSHGEAVAIVHGFHKQKIQASCQKA